jgi:enoyl-CoA hydratase/carnithine racemase
MSLTTLFISVINEWDRLTLTNPGKGNPINPFLCSEICEAAIKVSESSPVRCVSQISKGVD